MLNIGEFNELEILRATDFGWYLGSEDEDVLLPLKYGNENLKIGDLINVFVYKDNEGRPISTTLTPKLCIHQFALLSCRSTTNKGSFMDMGLSKDLFVPFNEQDMKIQEGSQHIIIMLYDYETDRLYGSAKYDNFLSNEELSVEEAEKVDLLIARHTDLGRVCIINNQHLGLIFKSDIREQLKVGQKKEGFIHRIREDNKIDVRLSESGYRNFINPMADRVMKAVERNGGVLSLGDKSSPEDIYEALKMSKKQYKQTIGLLYKKRLITVGKFEIKKI